MTPRLVALSVAILAALTPARAFACSLAYGAGARLVDEAEVIVRASAVEAVAGSIRFEVLETLKGTPPKTLALEGEFVEWTVPSESTLPPVMGRGRATATCYARNYRRGAEYLLLLKTFDGALSAEWGGMAATNEELTEPNETWLHWVRSLLELRRLNPGLKGTMPALCPTNMDLVSALRCSFSLDFDTFDVDGTGLLRKLSGRGAPRESRVPVPHGSLHAVHVAAHEGDLLLAYEAGDLESGTGVVTRVDGTTLAVKWHLRLAGFNHSLATIEGSRLYLGMIGGVAAIDLDRGAFIWKHDGLYDHATFRFNDFKRPIVRPVDVMFFENRDGPVHIAVNKQSGEMRVAGPYRWPIIHPFFSAVQAAPSFHVECRNDSGRQVSTADSRWPLIPDQLRIDDVQLALTGGIIGPGLSSVIEPGGIWNGIIELRQSATGVSPAVRFGAHVRSGHPVPLAEGRHTIAVKCGNRWSPPHVFYWEKQYEAPPARP